MQNTTSFISVDDLLRKEHRIVSSEEALRDVIPPDWSEDVLEEKSVVIGAMDDCLHAI